MDPGILLIADLVATMPTAREMMSCLLAAPVELERLLFHAPSVWKMLQARLAVLSRMARTGEGEAKAQHQLVLRQLLDHCAQAGDRRAIFHLSAMTEELALKWIGGECTGMSEARPLEARPLEARPLEAWPLEVWGDERSGDGQSRWMEELYRRHRIRGHAARPGGLEVFRPMAVRWLGGASAGEAGGAGELEAAPWFALALDNLARLVQLHAGYSWLVVGSRLAVQRELWSGDGSAGAPGGAIAGELGGELDEPAAYQVAMGCWMAWNLLASAYDSLLPAPRRPAALRVMEA